MEKVVLLFLIMQCLFKSLHCLCFTLPVVTNSQDNSGNYFLPLLSGEEVEVECRKGYKLVGDRTLTCNGDEKGNYYWQGAFPYCVEESWSVVSIDQSSENTPFDSTRQVIQLKFNQHSRPQNLRFWCNVHLFTDGDATDAKAYMSILYNFKDSQIVDSVVKYSSINESCIFCLDFSVPDTHVAEVITYDLVTKSKTFYDGVPGSGQCWSQVLDKWNKLVMSGTVTSLVYGCSVKDEEDEEEFGRHYSVAFRILQKDDSLCSSAPDIEHISPDIEHISAVDIDTPVYIGTKVHFQCDAGYTLTGSSWGYCQGSSNMYNFEIQPRCSPEKKEDDQEKYSTPGKETNKPKDTTNKNNKDTTNKSNKAKENKIDDNYNSYVAWTLVSILLVTLIFMGTYSAVLYKRPINYRAVSMTEPDANLLPDDYDKEESSEDETEDSD